MILPAAMPAQQDVPTPTRDAICKTFGDDRPCFGIPEIGSEDIEAPKVSPTTTYDTGVGGEHSSSLNVNVAGTVANQAGIKLTVEAGSSLIQIARQAHRRSNS